MSPTAVMLLMFLGLTTLTLILVYPQFALAQQLFGTVWAMIALRILGFQSGVLIAVFVVLWMTILWYRLRESVPLAKLSWAEWISLGLATALLISLAYTPSPQYGLSKALRFIGIVIPLVVASRFFCTSRERAKRTLDVVAVVALLTIAFYAAVYVLYRPLLTAGGRFGGGTSPLIMAWSVALSVVFVIYLLLSTPRLWLKVVAIGVALAGLSLIVASGSRGPFFGLAMAAILAFFGRKRIVLSLVVLAFLAALMFVAFYWIAPEIGRERMLRFTVSAGARMGLWGGALQQWLHRPWLGGGSGSFSVVVGHTLGRSYPHNMLFEFAAETGFPGFALTVLLVVFCVRPLLKLRSRYETHFAVSRAIQMLFWVGLFNALLSFDAPMQRGLFAAAGMLGAVGRWPELRPRRGRTATDEDSLQPGGLPPQRRLMPDPQVQPGGVRGL